MQLTLADAALDLVRGSTCLGCGRPGRMLCAGCADGLPRTAGPRSPTPAPPGLVPTYAAASYDDLVRAMVVAHKEHGARGLRPALVRLLAAAVRAALEDTAGASRALPVTLVPVPSRPGVARSRGDDPTGALVRGAARVLGRSGSDPVRVARLLVSRRGVDDQAGLGAVERARNLAGSMHVPSPRLAALARRVPVSLVIVCDDVLTTGATLREAQRALEGVGVHVAGAAALAATPRRTPPVTGPAVGPAVDPAVGRATGRGALP